MVPDNGFWAHAPLYTRVAWRWRPEHSTIQPTAKFHSNWSGNWFRTISTNNHLEPPVAFPAAICPNCRSSKNTPKITWISPLTYAIISSTSDVQAVKRLNFLPWNGENFWTIETWEFPLWSFSKHNFRNIFGFIQSFPERIHGFLNIFPDQGFCAGPSDPIFCPRRRCWFRHYCLLHNSYKVVIIS